MALHPFALIYTTLPTQQSAQAIAQQLVEQRLVACAHICAAGVSIYEWQGKIEQTAEVILWLKTTPERQANALKALESLHPYDIPCIIHMDSPLVNTSYWTWAQKNFAISD